MIFKIKGRFEMKKIRHINEQLRRLLKEDSNGKSTVYTPLTSFLSLDSSMMNIRKLLI